MPAPRNVLSPGDEVAGLYTVLRKVGEGGFAEVYEVTSADEPERKLALKIDRSPDVNTVSAEYKTMVRLQRVPQLCRVVEAATGSGRHRECSFFAMELLGANLAHWRQGQPHARLSPLQAASAAGDILELLEGMHTAGYLHRDVKPANFALAQRSGGYASELAAIDFGLARRFRDEAGALLPKRPQHEFRGSSTYASPAAHHKQDLGRKDDLLSLLFILVELLTGTLPWRTGRLPTSEADKQAILAEKEACLADPHRLFGGSAPDCIPALSEYLASLVFESAPDYGIMRDCLAEIAELPPDSFTPPPPRRGQAAPPHPSSRSTPIAPGGGTDPWGDRATPRGKDSPGPPPCNVQALLEQLDSPQGSPADAPRGVPEGRPPRSAAQQNGRLDLPAQLPTTGKRGLAAGRAGKDDTESPDGGRYSRAAAAAALEPHTKRQRVELGSAARRPLQPSPLGPREGGPREGRPADSQQQRQRDAQPADPQQQRHSSREPRPDSQQQQRQGSRERQLDSQQHRQQQRQGSRELRPDSQQQQQGRREGRPADPQQQRQGSRDLQRQGSSREEAEGRSSRAPASGAGARVSVEDLPAEEQRQLLVLRDCARAVEEDQLSALGAAAKRRLVGLDPAEGFAILAWTVLELRRRAEQDRQPEVTKWLRSLSYLANAPC